MTTITLDYKPMRLALLTDGIYPIVMGGMQKHSYYLAKYFASKGIDVDVYHAIPNGTQTENPSAVFSDDELKHLNFIPVSFPRNHLFPGHYIWESYIYSKRVYQQFVKQQAVDFVYVQGFAGWYLMKRKYQVSRHKYQEFENIKVTVGINFHGMEMFQKAPNMRVKLEHLLLQPWVKKNLRMADAIFSLGGRLTPIQQSIAPSNKIFDIPNGISNTWITETEIIKSKNSVQFAFIGRYERRKGIEELTSVLTELSITHPSLFTCHFIGPIPEEKRLHNLSNVVYHGSFREEAGIKSILMDSDVLLCPSWSEGMPTVILEAMACGCAIVASDVGAVRDQVGEDNGILIAPGDKKQIKEAMIRMIHKDKTELKKMQQASIAKIKDKFLWDKIIEQTITAINNTITKH